MFYLFIVLDNLFDSFLAFPYFQFEDPRDAEDAIHGRDGCKFDGHRLRVSNPILVPFHCYL